MSYPIWIVACQRRSLCHPGAQRTLGGKIVAGKNLDYQTCADGSDSVCWVLQGRLVDLVRVAVVRVILREVLRDLLDLQATAFRAFEIREFVTQSEVHLTNCESAIS